MNRSVEFFDTQFRQQVAQEDYALNPFEKATLPFVQGRVLDLGCGLGNLSLAAARKGARVTAVDASTTAMVRIARTSLAEDLGMCAVIADVGRWRIAGEYDAIVAIGLLMFMRRDEALALLEEIKRHVARGGVAAVNVLVEGTTYMEMFEPGAYYLFAPDGVERGFAGWKIELARREAFDASGGTKKLFSTVVARKP